MVLFYMLKSIFLVKHLDNPRNRRTFALANKKHRGVEQLVARQAHNLEVARSSRTPATRVVVRIPVKACTSFFWDSFFYMAKRNKQNIYVRKLKRAPRTLMENTQG